MKLLKKIIQKIRNKLFKKRDLFEELTGYKKEEYSYVNDKEIIDWFWGSN